MFFPQDACRFEKYTSPSCSKTPTKHHAATPVLHRWGGVLRLTSFPHSCPNAATLGFLFPVNQESPPSASPLDRLCSRVILHSFSPFRTKNQVRQTQLSLHYVLPPGIQLCPHHTKTSPQTMLLENSRLSPLCTYPCHLVKKPRILPFTNCLSLTPHICHNNS